MRSKLAAHIFVPMPRSMANGRPVSSHRPVHRSAPHSYVRSNGMPAAFALWLAPWIITVQGFACRCACFLTIRLVFARALFFSCQSRLRAAASWRCLTRYFLSDALTASGCFLRCSRTCSTMRCLYESVLAYFSRLVRLYSGCMCFRVPCALLHETLHRSEQYLWRFVRGFMEAPQVLHGRISGSGNWRLVTENNNGFGAYGATP